MIKRTPLRRISLKQLAKQDAWWKLVAYLTVHRAQNKCELCHKEKSEKVKLDGHHIIKRSLMGAWQAWNCIILCRRCHDRQVNNTPQQVEALLKLVEKLNKQYGIDPHRGYQEEK